MLNGAGTPIRKDQHKVQTFALHSIGCRSLTNNDFCLPPRDEKNMPKDANSLCCDLPTDFFLTCCVQMDVDNMNMDVDNNPLAPVAAPVRFNIFACCQSLDRFVVFRYYV